MSLRLKLELLAAGLIGIAGVVTYFAWQHHERQIGAAQVEAADAKAVAVEKERQAEQLQHEQEATHDALAALKIERDRLAATLAATPAPVLRLCASPRSGSGVPATARAPGSPGATTAAGGTIPPVPAGADAGSDIGPGVQLLAVMGERLSAQLRAVQAREVGLHQ